MWRRQHRRMVASLLGLGIIIGLSGCGASMPSAGSDAKVSANTEFRGSGLKSGMVLGWDNRLYQLVGTVNENQVGKKLDQVTYHGTLGMSFTLFALAGQPASHAIVFETTQGKFFKAIVTSR